MKSVDIISSNHATKKEQTPKKTKCLKLLLIILSIVIVLAVIFILVAKFKYNFFKKEIYQVAEIKRELGSTEYYTEKKTMVSKMLYTNGELQESEQIINSKFVVMITDRLNLENNDYLNTAALIILESKIQMEGKEAELESLNIFDEEVMKKFENNPENAKYPMAIFHFYKNGTLKDIKLPLNSSKDDIENMVDLINEVAPKLARNKTEDDNKGIQIISKEDKKIKSFKEYQPQKEFVNKYTNSSIKGSKITKEVERDITDKKLTKVIANTNLYMETEKKKEDTYLELGIENLYFNVSSNITPYEMNENKNDKDLIKKVIAKQSYEDSEELIKLILEKEKEEQKKENENTIESENQLRSLGKLDGVFGFEWTILEFNVLGIGIKGIYKIGLSGKKIKNTLQFESGSIVIPIGNSNGKNSNGNEKLTRKDIELAKILLMPFLHLSFKIGPEVSTGLYIGTDYFDINFSGGIYAKASVEVGAGNFAKLEAGVKGSILSADFTTKIGKNYDGSFYKKYIRMEANSGRFEIYAEAYVLWWKVLDERQTIWNGWTKTWYY